MFIPALCQKAKNSTLALSNSTTQEKSHTLHRMADRLLAASNSILSANQRDVDAAREKGLPQAMVDRLTLTEQRLNAMASGIKAIAALPDPVHRILAKWHQPNGLTIKRVAVPIGVIAVVYEARPNVTTDAAALCIQSGNAVILRGGSESIHSNRAITKVIRDTLADSPLPQECIQTIDNIDRTLVDELIQQHEFVDVIIPRGGERLIRHLMEHSKIPLFKHLQGLCHAYIHQHADLNKAIQVCFNAKLRRTGICGAMETLLVDRTIAPSVLPSLVAALQSDGCEIRGDTNVCALLSPKAITLATEQDWKTEYLDAVLSIRIVADLDDALRHIRQYSSQHTDAIITEDTKAAHRFFNEVDSAIVMHNTSTQFADGGEFGMGAEIGIATGKLHARGPVGVEQLTTFKYLVSSDGATRPN